MRRGELINIFSSILQRKMRKEPNVNTRVHLYLDVPKCKREQDVTWFPNEKKM